MSVRWSQTTSRGLRDRLLTSEVKRTSKFDFFFSPDMLSEDFFDAENSDPGQVLEETFLLVLI